MVQGAEGLRAGVVLAEGLAQPQRNLGDSKHVASSRGGDSGFDGQKANQASGEVRVCNHLQKQSLKGLASVKGGMELSPDSPQRPVQRWRAESTSKPAVPSSER